MEKTAEISQITSFEEDEMLNSEFKDVIITLPRKINWNGLYMYQYQGYWISSPAIQGMISFQKNFHAKDTDVLLITLPKSGTTWLKALTFSIVKRNHYALAQSPLLTSSPHALVPFLEYAIYGKGQNPNLDSLPSPRIFSTHSPYSLLPHSIKDSDCRIVYMCRNPLDQIISLWHFLDSNRARTPGDLKVTSLEDALDMFCEGDNAFGPVWDHVLGYWKESMERSDKVLFLTYEDLKEDTIPHIKRLANFIGFPFSEEEEKQGVVEEISRLCSFESLKGLEANKQGKQGKQGKRSWGVENSAYFRKGKVGDWANYLSPSMANRIESVMQEKLSGSGLTFKVSVEENH